MAESTQQSLQDSSIDFDTALDRLRDGVDTWSEENHVIHDLLEVAEQEGVATGPFGHPKITQAIFRYRHDAETVRGEIKRGIEIYDLDASFEEVATVIKQAAIQAGDDHRGENT